ncbi:S24 family peptidase [Flagellimonas onchidii]|uniref:S24 family peptidase n=1 Tax=Flagellimonas onchidii TaxID=2562684 RepID=UPI0010A5DAFD|nr:S24 family peptidase [Allomuricauda onchidii]
MITQRIKEYVNFKELTVSSFESSIGASNGMLRRAFKEKTDIKSQWLENILENYHDINPVWLITGKGEMINPKNAKNLTQNYGKEKGKVYENEPKVQSNEVMEMEQTPVITNGNGKKNVYLKKFALMSDANVEHQLVPLYNIEASAGLVTLFADTKSYEPIDYVQIPNLPHCDGGVHVTGDSMYPILKSGDIVLYKQIEDIENNIFWGEMYLISIDMDGDDFTTLKYIQKSDKGEKYVKLVSHNQHHQPRDLEISRIRALAFVKASVRMNTMG